MKQDLIAQIQVYVARYSVSPSAVRGQPAGLVVAARRYLGVMPLTDFAVRSRLRFLANLERHTERLRSTLPRRARSWGVARKLLNIFLRNALYTSYLRDRYHLERAEDWYEVPLDSIVATKLREKVGARVLPRWLGVRHLLPASSGIYQSAARDIAEEIGVAAVHLDAVWWGGPRDATA